MFNTNCYGNENIPSYTQGVESPWAAHTTHNSQGIFHQHPVAGNANAFVGYGLGQVQSKELDLAGVVGIKESTAASTTSQTASANAWHHSHRMRYQGAATPSRGFLPYQMSPLPHYDSQTVDTTHLTHTTHHQSYWVANPNAYSLLGSSYQRDHNTGYAERADTSRSTVTMRHNSTMSNRTYAVDDQSRNVNPSLQQQTAQILPQHCQRQSRQQIHQLQQHQHQQLHQQQDYLRNQMTQRDRDPCQYTSNFHQDSMRVSMDPTLYHDQHLIPPAQHQHQQYQTSQEALRKASENERRTAFSSRQTCFAQTWAKSPYVPFDTSQTFLSNHRSTGSAFQPCNKQVDSDPYSMDSIWAKSAVATPASHVSHGTHAPNHTTIPPSNNHMALPTQSWLHDTTASHLKVGHFKNAEYRPPQEVNQVTNVPSNFSANVLNLDTGQVELSMSMVPPEMPIYPQTVSQTQRHRTSTSQPPPRSLPVPTVPRVNQSKPVLKQVPPPKAVEQPKTTPTARAAGLDVRQFLATWDEDLDLATPRPACVEMDEPDTPSTSLVVLDYQNVPSEEAAGLLQMYPSLQLVPGGNDMQPVVLLDNGFTPTTTSGKPNLDFVLSRAVPTTTTAVQAATTAVYSKEATQRDVQVNEALSAINVVQPPAQEKLNAPPSGPSFSLEERPPSVVRVSEVNPCQDASKSTNVEKTQVDLSLQPHSQEAATPASLCESESERNKKSSLRYFRKRKALSGDSDASESQCSEAADDVVAKSAKHSDSEAHYNSLSNWFGNDSMDTIDGPIRTPISVSELSNSSINSALECENKSTQDDRFREKNKNSGEDDRCASNSVSVITLNSNRIEKVGKSMPDISGECDNFAREPCGEIEKEPIEETEEKETEDMQRNLSEIGLGNVNREDITQNPLSDTDLTSDDVVGFKTRADSVEKPNDGSNREMIEDTRQNSGEETNQGSMYETNEGTSDEINRQSNNDVDRNIVRENGNDIGRKSVDKLVQETGGEITQETSKVNVRIPAEETSRTDDEINRNTCRDAGIRETREDDAREAAEEIRENFNQNIYAEIGQKAAGLSDRTTGEEATRETCGDLNGASAGSIYTEQAPPVSEKPCNIERDSDQGMNREFDTINHDSSNAEQDSCYAILREYYGTDVEVTGDNVHPGVSQSEYASEYFSTVPQSGTVIQPQIFQSQELTGDPPVASSEHTRDPPIASSELTSGPPIDSFELTSDPPIASSELTDNQPIIPCELTGDPPFASSELTGDPPIASSELTDNPPIGPSELTGDPPLAPSELTENQPIAPSELTENQPIAPSELTGGPPVAPSELTGDPPIAPSDLTGDPPIAPPELTGDPPVASSVSPKLPVEVTEVSTSLATSTKYLSRIVGSAPGKIPKILLSRLKGVRRKKRRRNGVVKKLPSIRLTRVQTSVPLNEDELPEYMCSEKEDDVAKSNEKSSGTGIDCRMDIDSVIATCQTETQYKENKEHNSPIGDEEMKSAIDYSSCNLNESPRPIDLSIVSSCKASPETIINLENIPFGRQISPRLTTCSEEIPYLTAATCDAMPLSSDSSKLNESSHIFSGHSCYFQEVLEESSEVNGRSPDGEKIAFSVFDPPVDSARNSPEQRIVSPCHSSLIIEEARLSLITKEDPPLKSNIIPDIIEDTSEVCHSPKDDKTETETPVMGSLRPHRESLSNDILYSQLHTTSSENTYVETIAEEKEDSQGKEISKPSSPESENEEISTEVPQNIESTNAAVIPPLSNPEAEIIDICCESPVAQEDDVLCKTASQDDHRQGKEMQTTGSSKFDCVLSTTVESGDTVPSSPHLTRNEEFGKSYSVPDSDRIVSPSEDVSSSWEQSEEVCVSETQDEEQSKTEELKSETSVIAEGAVPENNTSADSPKDPSPCRSAIERSYPDQCFSQAELSPWEDTSEDAPLEPLSPWEDTYVGEEKPDSDEDTHKSPFVSISSGISKITSTNEFIFPELPPLSTKRDDNKLERAISSPSSSSSGDDSSDSVHKSSTSGSGNASRSRSEPGTQSSPRTVRESSSEKSDPDSSDEDDDSDDKSSVSSSGSSKKSSSDPDSVSESSSSSADESTEDEKEECMEIPEKHDRLNCGPTPISEHESDSFLDDWEGSKNCAVLGDWEVSKTSAVEIGTADKPCSPEIESSGASIVNESSMPEDDLINDTETRGLADETELNVEDPSTTRHELNTPSVVENMLVEKDDINNRQPNFLCETTEFDNPNDSHPMEKCIEETTTLSHSTETSTEETFAMVDVIIASCGEEIVEAAHEEVVTSQQEEVNVPGLAAGIDENSVCENAETLEVVDNVEMNAGGMEVVEEEETVLMYTESGDSLTIAGNVLIESDTDNLHLIHTLNGETSEKERHGDEIVDNENFLESGVETACFVMDEDDFNDLCNGTIEFYTADSLHSFSQENFAEEGFEVCGEILNGEEEAYPGTVSESISEVGEVECPMESNQEVFYCENVETPPEEAVVNGEVSCDIGREEVCQPCLGIEEENAPSEVVPASPDSAEDVPHVEEILLEKDDNASGLERRKRKRPLQVKCSLSWDRILNEGQGIVLGPANVEVRVPGDPEKEHTHWKVVTRERRRAALVPNTSSCVEENNNLMPNVKSPVVVVKRLVLKRPRTRRSRRTIKRSEQNSLDTEECCLWDNEDLTYKGLFPLKTKGALKSFQASTESSLNGRGRNRSWPSATKDVNLPKTRSTCKRRRSELSPTRSDWTNLNLQRLPKVIIKRTGKGPQYRSFIYEEHIMQPVVALERNPELDSLALSMWNNVASSPISDRGSPVQNDCSSNETKDDQVAASDSLDEYGTGKPQSRKPHPGKVRRAGQLMKVVELLQQRRIAEQVEVSKSPLCEEDLHQDTVENNNSLLCVDNNTDEEPLKYLTPIQEKSEPCWNSGETRSEKTPQPVSQVCDSVSICGDIADDLSISGDVTAIPDDVALMPNHAADNTDSVADFPGSVPIISSNVAAISDDVAVLSGDVDVLSGDVDVISSDVADQSGVVTVISSDVTGLPRDAADIPADVADIPGNVAGIPDDVPDIPGYVTNISDSVADGFDDVPNTGGDVALKETRVTSDSMIEKVSLQDNGSVHEDYTVLPSEDIVEEESSIGQNDMVREEDIIVEKDSTVKGDNILSSDDVQGKCTLLQNDTVIQEDYSGVQDENVMANDTVVPDACHGPDTPSSQENKDNESPRNDSTLGLICQACSFSGTDPEDHLNHIKTHSYHCQRCLQAFLSHEDFKEHLTAVHPSIEEIHHCLLCQRTFSSAELHAQHIKDWNHCLMERTQRHTIHRLYRIFTGSDCPYLPALDPEDVQSLDGLPSDPGVIHFYHEPTPLQLALQDYNAHLSRRPTEDVENS